MRCVSKQEVVPVQSRNNVGLGMRIGLSLDRDHLYVVSHSRPQSSEEMRKSEVKMELVARMSGMFALDFRRAALRS